MTPIKAAADPSREALKPCPLCRSANVALGICYVEFRPNMPAVRCCDCGCRATLEAWNTRSAPAGNAGVRLSGEQCDAFIKATGEWIEPHEPETEDGHPIEMGITQEEADEFNAEAREQIRKGFAAALALPQPREAEPVAWMNREHLEAYTAGNPRGIAWASPEPTEFYDVALCASPSPIPEAPKDALCSLTGGVCQYRTEAVRQVQDDK